MAAILYYTTILYTQTVKYDRPNNYLP